MVESVLLHRAESAGFDNDCLTDHLVNKYLQADVDLAQLVASGDVSGDVMYVRSFAFGFGIHTCTDGVHHKFGLRGSKRAPPSVCPNCSQPLVGQEQRSFEVVTSLANSDSAWARVVAIRFCHTSVVRIGGMDPSHSSFLAFIRQEHGRPAHPVRMSLATIRQVVLDQSGRGLYVKGGMKILLKC